MISKITYAQFIVSLKAKYNNRPDQQKALCRLQNSHAPNTERYPHTWMDLYASHLADVRKEEASV